MVFNVFDGIGADTTWQIAVILFIAYEICLLGQKAKKWDGIKILLGYGLVATLGVFLLTDNLSTAIIVFAITCILIFVVHPKTKPFVAGVIAAGIEIYACGK